MEIENILGTAGALMMLMAYLINMSDKVSNDNLFYLFLNIVGGALAAIGSYLTAFYPLVFLEGAWSILSIGSLIKNIFILKKYKREK